MTLVGGVYAVDAIAGIVHAALRDAAPERPHAADVTLGACQSHAPGPSMHQDRVEACRWTGAGVSSADPKALVAWRTQEGTVVVWWRASRRGLCVRPWA